MRRICKLFVMLAIFILCTTAYAEDCTGFYNKSRDNVIYTQLPDGPIRQGFLPGESYINKFISVDIEATEEIIVLRHGTINANPLPANHSLIFYGYDQKPAWEIKTGCNG